MKIINRSYFCKVVNSQNQLGMKYLFSPLCVFNDPVYNTYECRELTINNRAYICKDCIDSVSMVLGGSQFPVYAIIGQSFHIFCIILSNGVVMNI